MCPQRLKHTSIKRFHPLCRFDELQPNLPCPLGIDGCCKQSSPYVLKFRPTLAARRLQERLDYGQWHIIIGRGKRLAAPMKNLACALHYLGRVLLALPVRPITKYPHALCNSAAGGSASGAVSELRQQVHRLACQSALNFDP